MACLQAILAKLKITVIKPNSRQVNRRVARIIVHIIRMTNAKGHGGESIISLWNKWTMDWSRPIIHAQPVEWIVKNFGARDVVKIHHKGTFWYSIGKVLVWAERVWWSSCIFIAIAAIEVGRREQPFFCDMLFLYALVDMSYDNLFDYHRYFWSGPRDRDLKYLQNNIANPLSSSNNSTKLW